MMRKFTVVALAATVASPLLAQAGDMGDGPKWYGRVHVSLEKWTNPDPIKGETEAQINGKSNRANSIGVKGSVDTKLMDFKGIYQLEVGMDMESSTSTGLAKERDTYVGLASKKLGTFRAGTVESNWKSSAKVVDPLFTTPLEGRGDLNIDDTKAGSSGHGKGRATDSIRYDSPSIMGAKLVAMYTFANKASIGNFTDNNLGVGLHYKNKGIQAFFDYFNDGRNTDGSASKPAVSAMKVGGKVAMGPMFAGLAYTIDSGWISGNADDTQNVTFLNAGYKMGDATVTFSYGMKADSSTPDSGHKSMALAGTYSLTKKAKLYAGWGQKTPNDTTKDPTSVLTGGMYIKF